MSLSIADTIGKYPETLLNKSGIKIEEIKKAIEEDTQAKQDKLNELNKKINAPIQAKKDRMSEINKTMSNTEYSVENKNMDDYYRLLEEYKSIRGRRRKHIKSRLILKKVFRLKYRRRYAISGRSQYCTQWLQ